MKELIKSQLKEAINTKQKLTDSEYIDQIHDAGKIFTMFYVLTGIGIIFAFIRASTARRINRKNNS